MQRALATRELRIETSTLCNYDCVMCARDSLRRTQELMPDELFERIVAHAREELPELRICTVSGFGELSLDPGWRRKLAVARASFETVHVVSNLSAFEGPDLELLAELASEVRVSIYAVDEASYARVHRPRGGIGFAEVEGRIRKLAALRSERFRLGVTCCLVEENEGQLEAWIARFRELADHLEVWRPHNWITARRYRPIAGPRLPSCGRPAGGPIQVQVDGTLNVCCFDYNGEMLIGDLRRESLSEIYAGPELARIRRLHAEGRADELPLCRVCDQRAPDEQKRANLVYCSRADPADRVRRTTSGLEKLPDT